jgi:hypothetical protein
MVNSEGTSTPISTSYGKPVVFGAIGFVALQIAVGAIVIRPFLLETAAPEDVSFVTLLTLLHGAIWGLAALGMFLWAIKVSRRILKFPQGEFHYNRIFTGFLLVCAIVMALRAAWVISQGGVDSWQTTQGALVMTTLCIQVLTGLWGAGTAWLRFRGLGFARPASVGAVVFWTLAFLPAGLIGVPLYLVTRRHDGRVLGKIEERGSS